MNISQMECSKNDKWWKNVLHACEKDLLRWCVLLLTCVVVVVMKKNVEMHCMIVRRREYDDEWCGAMTRDWCAGCRGTDAGLMCAMWCDDAGLMCGMGAGCRGMGAGCRGTDVRDVVRCGAMWCDDAGLIAIDYSVNGLILNNYKWVQLMGWINLNISQLRCCKTWKMLEECIAWLWEDECDDVCCDWCVLWLLWWRRMCAMVCMIVRRREYEDEWWGRQLAQ